MIVRRPRLELAATQARLVTRVESDSGAFEPCTVSLGVARAHADWIDTTGSPWVPPLLILAARLGEDLRLEAPVSRRLLGGAAQAGALFAEWWGFRVPRIEAEPAVDAGPPGPEALCCFTRGVDSWFSVRRLLAGDGGPRPTRLLYGPDLDHHYSPPRRREAVRRTAEAAAQLGLPLLVVHHDIRALLDRFLLWEDTHGGVLAGTALALGHAVATFVQPAGYDLAHAAPTGSTPDLDPLWSTERTTVIHHAAEVGRTAKVRALADDPIVLPRLKVCWNEDIDDNCGRCRKCLRTMLQLALAGALDRTDAFRAPLSLDAFVALPPPRRDRRRMLFAELYDAMPDDPEWAEWKEALRARLSWWHPHAPRRPPVPDGLRIVIEAPPGTAMRLASPLARGVLPGALVTHEPAAADPPDVRRLEVTWTQPAPGRVALPWRPAAAHRETLLAACRARTPRSVPWCLLDLPTPGTAEVVRTLTAAWGPGLVCAPHRETPDADHGSARALADDVQRRALVRAWRGDGEQLDPFRVLEALRHGCLPLQCVGADERERLVAALPPGLDAFVLSLDAPLPPLDAGDVAARLDRGLSVVLAGSLERDLHLALRGLAPVAA
jgi:hypothetical protein